MIPLKAYAHECECGHSKIVLQVCADLAGVYCVAFVEMNQFPTPEDALAYAGMTASALELQEVPAEAVERGGQFGS